MNALSDDESLLLLALVRGADAGRAGETPVGAVVADTLGRPIGEGGNRTRRDCDPMAHAEAVALRQAARRRGDFRLEGARLAVSLEPCPLCREAARAARVEDLLFAGRRPPEKRIGPAGGGREASGDGTAERILMKFFEGVRQA